jgi:hypothetical protein
MKVRRDPHLIQRYIIKGDTEGNFRGQDTCTVNSMSRYTLAVRIGPYALELRVIQSPKCMVWSVADCTYIHLYIPLTLYPRKGQQRHLRYSSEMPTFYHNYSAMSNTADVTGGKPIAVWSQSISGVRAINPLVAFYDIFGRKSEVLFFYFVLNTTREHVHTTVYPRRGSRCVTKDTPRCSYFTSVRYEFYKVSHRMGDCTTKSVHLRN